MTNLRLMLGALLCCALMASPAFAESDAGAGVPADATATGDAGSTDAGSTDASDLPDTSTQTGDGGPKPAANSCVARCGSYNSSAACQCDADCSKPENNDCCADIQTVCVGGACGNGKCEAGESGANCVVDCVKCGDAVCEDAEKDSCAADCDPSYNGNPCYDEKCKDPIAKCKADTDCNKFLACVKTGAAADDCGKELGLNQTQADAINAFFKAISDCGKENCTVAGSDTCKDRCETEYNADFACQCDGECLQYKDCCPDYETLCAACQPQCDGKQCGPDGCGGNCGACPSGTTCNAGAGKCESGSTGGTDAGGTGDSTSGGTTDTIGDAGGTDVTGGTGGTGGTAGGGSSSSSSSGCTAAPSSNGATGLLLVLGLVFGLVVTRRRFA